MRENEGVHLGPEERTLASEGSDAGDAWYRAGTHLWTRYPRSVVWGARWAHAAGDRGSGNVRHQQRGLGGLISPGRGGWPSEKPTRVLSGALNPPHRGLQSAARHCEDEAAGRSHLQGL